MSKRVKNLIVLSLVVALLVFAYIFVSRVNSSEDTEEQTDSTITLCEFDETQIQSFHYKTESDELTFNQTGGVWYYEGDESFPVTQNTLSEMAESVATVNATRKLDNPEDISNYGLDEPSLVVDITSNDKTYSFSVGDYTAYTSEYYVLYEDDVYLMDSTLTETFSKDLYDYLTTSSLESFDEIVSFTIDENSITDEEKVSELSDSYENLTLGSVADYKNKEEYGFDGTEHKVTITYNVKTDVTDDSGNTTSTITNTLTYTFSYAYVNDISYIMPEGDELIYYISGVENFDI